MWVGCTRWRLFSSRETHHEHSLSHNSLGRSPAWEAMPRKSFPEVAISALLMFVTKALPLEAEGSVAYPAHPCWSSAPSIYTCVWESSPPIIHPHFQLVSWMGDFQWKGKAQGDTAVYDGKWSCIFWCQVTVWSLAMESKPLSERLLQPANNFPLLFFTKKYLH